MFEIKLETELDDVRDDRGRDLSWQVHEELQPLLLAVKIFRTLLKLNLKLFRIVMFVDLQLPSYFLHFCCFLSVVLVYCVSRFHTFLNVDYVKYKDDHILVVWVTGDCSQVFVSTIELPLGRVEFLSVECRLLFLDQKEPKVVSQNIAFVLLFCPVKFSFALICLICFTLLVDSGCFRRNFSFFKAILLAVSEEAFKKSPSVEDRWYF